MPAGNKRPPAPSEATPLVSKGSSGLSCLATRDAATTTTIVIVLFAILLKQASNASVAASLSEMRAIGRPEVALYFPALGSVFYGLGKVNNIFITYRIGPRIVLNLSALVSGAFYLLIVATSLVLYKYIEETQSGDMDTPVIKPSAPPSDDYDDDT